MKNYDKCPLCHEWHFDHEKCKPKFEYQIPEYYDADDWSEVRAYTFEEAATEACAKNDCEGDYKIVQAGGIDLIHIRDSNGVIKSFSIYAHPIPDYEAREIKSEVKR